MTPIRMVNGVGGASTFSFTLMSEPKIRLIYFINENNILCCYEL